MTLISVIVTTYNWPEVLTACLTSLSAQIDKNFEVVIADDGSTHETTALIKRFMQQVSFSVQHVVHEDRGFRAATIRNKAVALSHGDYLIFLDGDCVVFPNFISRHRRLAERGFFVPGNRILLSHAFTIQVLQDHLLLYDKTIWQFMILWIQRYINRIFPLLYNPCAWLRYRKPHRWQKAMTCNLAMYKHDFIAINGFDEVFEGWGYEDSDLIVRLIHYGIKRKEGRFAVPVLHFWHRENDRDQHDINYQRLMLRLQDTRFIRAVQGIDQYSRDI